MRACIDVCMYMCVYTCICMHRYAHTCRDVCMHMCSCVQLFDPMECSPPCSSVHGISQARILELVAIFSSRGSFQPRDEPMSPVLADGFFTTEPPGSPKITLFSSVCRSVVSDSLRHHGLQHARPPYPSPTPRIYPNSGPLSR